SGDPRDAGEPDDGDRHRRSGGPAAVAEFAVRVASPALHGAAGNERARVRTTGRDLQDAGEIDDLRQVRVDRRAVTELREEVVAPAASGAVTEPRAGVAAGGRDLRRARQPRYALRRARVRIVAVAQ